MAKKNGLGMFVGLATLIASIAVGLAMTDGTLVVPILGDTINVLAGWIVVAGGVVSALQMSGLMKK